MAHAHPICCQESWPQADSTAGKTCFEGTNPPLSAAAVEQQRWWPLGLGDHVFPGWQTQCLKYRRMKAAWSGCTASTARKMKKVWRTTLATDSRNVMSWELSAFSEHVSLGCIPLRSWNLQWKAHPWHPSRGTCCLSGWDEPWGIQHQSWCLLMHPRLCLNGQIAIPINCGPKHDLAIFS